MPFSLGLTVFVIAFGLYMPFLGGSMLFVFLGERFILRHILPPSAGSACDRHHP